MTFQGFPAAALDFYDDLETDNTKSFWQANKEVYETAVRAPMVALTDALAAEFGEAKLFRPYRDVRFAKDKTPYKTHQGAFVETGPATGWYVQLGAGGVRVAAGYYAASGERVTAVREAIDGPDGNALATLLRKLERAGWTVGGETLRSTPRGYPADHPRIELLRHKTITVGKDYGFGEIIHRPDLLAQVRKDWRAARPLIEWITAHTQGT